MNGKIINFDWRGNTIETLVIRKMTKIVMLIFIELGLQLFTLKCPHTPTSTSVNHKTFERITWFNELSNLVKILVRDSFTFNEICADVFPIRCYVSSHDIIRIEKGSHWTMSHDLINSLTVNVNEDRPLVALIVQVLFNFIPKNSFCYIYAELAEVYRNNFSH